MITNYEIADCFSMLAKIMDIHGENSFKTKSYATAAFQLEKLQAPLHAMSDEEIAAQKGIGLKIAEKVREMLNTGKLALLDQYLASTPPGVIEMLNIKGIGPKKIHTIWKEMGIESIGELQYACNENRLLLYKGFGAKTQQNVEEAIRFYQNQQGLFLYSEAEAIARSWMDVLLPALPEQSLTVFTGAYRRQMEVLDTIELLSTAEPASWTVAVQQIPGAAVTETSPESIRITVAQAPQLVIYFAHSSNWGIKLLETTGNATLFGQIMHHLNGKSTDNLEETQIFQEAGIPYVHPSLRDLEDIVETAKSGKMTEIIRQDSIKGIIHTHTTWSDGGHTIEEMAIASRDAGMEYIVISDHSKSAGYANGLQEQRISRQHQEIDELNKRLAPFRIFKSIECDILGDGSLDYTPEVLSTFDLVIASVHSNLKMSEEKAMSRLLQAISNPFVTILGHMTGRLLLSRNGYPLNVPEIISQCVQHHVAIELNAHPRRLDIDWRWLCLVRKEGALISINPDAHEINGFSDIRFGVLAAQKGMITSSQNLSSFSLKELESYLDSVRRLKGLNTER